MQKKTPNILVFQHIECEHPGSLRRFLEKADVKWQGVHLYDGEAIPPLENYDALWVMGGPMDVWDVEEHPWLVPEKAAIARWVREIRKPYLGLCLGHQLLADALNGTCGPLSPPEIGVMEIALTEEGKKDPIFAGMPARQSCLQWHSVQVSQPPADAVILASSQNCRVQAMRIGEHAWSMQYHIEVEPDTVQNWNAVPAYREALLKSIGESGYEEMQRKSDEGIDGFLSSAEILCNNFLKTLERVN